MRRAAAATLAVLLSLSPASALVVVNNPGGAVVQFYRQEMELEARGEPVVVRGRCASACTVVLHNPRVCVAPGGSFMFHSAFIPVDPANGDFRRAEDSPEATSLMWSMYPAGVRAWINARGGMTARPLFMSAEQAWAAGVARCR